MSLHIVNLSINLDLFLLLRVANKLLSKQTNPNPYSSLPFIAFPTASSRSKFSIFCLPMKLSFHSTYEGIIIHVLSLCCKLGGDGTIHLTPKIIDLMQPRKKFPFILNSTISWVILSS